MRKVVTTAIFFLALIHLAGCESKESGVEGMSSWAAFKAQRPTTAKTVRVVASLDDYYNYQFSGMNDKYYSVELENGEGSLGIHGYVEKESGSGEKIFNIIKDGDSHKLMLKIKYMGYGSSDSNTLLIEEFVAEGWSSK
jgi:hypothetical protein